mmetsp:Transcript_21800/g.60664  ORF Transcript_21800/g.60664 Transcript_21800/m.60664 type:complete len:208 (-) Transcript_21800:56-679(-)
MKDTSCIATCDRTDWRERSPRIWNTRPVLPSSCWDSCSTNSRRRRAIPGRPRPCRNPFPSHPSTNTLRNTRTHPLRTRSPKSKRTSMRPRRFCTRPSIPSSSVAPNSTVWWSDPTTSPPSPRCSTSRPRRRIAAVSLVRTWSATSMRPAAVMLFKRVHNRCVELSRVGWNGVEHGGHGGPRVWQECGWSRDTLLDSSLSTRTKQKRT